MIRRALITLIFASMRLVAQAPEPAPDPVPSIESIPVPEAPPAVMEPALQSSRVSVLGYHDFSPTLPETEMRIRTAKFRWQMQALRDRGITVISLADFIADQLNFKEYRPIDLNGFLGKSFGNLSEVMVGENVFHQAI